MRANVMSLVGLACLALGSGGAVAQDGAQPFLVFEHEGLSALFVDERDFALRDALAMAPARVAELPREMPDMPPEAAEVLSLVLRTVSRPARVAITYEGTNPTGGLFGYGLIAGVSCADRAEVDEVRARVMEVIEGLEEAQRWEMPLRASERFEHMEELWLPFGLLSFGPRETDSGWRYEIMIGTVNDPDEAFERELGGIDEPGFTPYGRAQLDFSALTPAARMATNLLGGQAPQVREVAAGLEEAGLIGENAVRVEYAAGSTETHALQRTAMVGARPLAGALHLPMEPLDPSALQAVPADAYAVSMGPSGLDSLEGVVEQLMSSGVPVGVVLEGFAEATGVDLMNDVLGSLGGTFAFYSSDSTGGGSLLSAVLLVEVENRERLTRAMRRLATVANRVIAEEGDMPATYVLLEGWSDTLGADLITLRFPGLPVPLELSLAMTDGWLVAAATPQAAVAAARQASGHGDAGLLANPRFGEVFAARGDGAASFTFIDTPRTIARGYPALTLIGSAVSNAIRSPHDPRARVPGMVVPVYRDLVGPSAQPMVKITRWEGDDLVTTTTMDRSLLVQAAGSMGAASSALPILAGSAAAVGVLGSQVRMMGPFSALPQPGVMVAGLRRSLFVDPVAEFTLLLGAATSPAAGELLPAGAPGR